MDLLYVSGAFSRDQQPDNQLDKYKENKPQLSCLNLSKIHSDFFTDHHLTPVTRGLLKHIFSRSTYVMKFVIKTTGVTDRLSILVSSPQSRGGCFTVSTAGSFSSGRRLKN